MFVGNCVSSKIFVSKNVALLRLAAVFVISLVRLPQKIRNIYNTHTHTYLKANQAENTLY